MILTAPEAAAGGTTHEPANSFRACRASSVDMGKWAGDQSCQVVRVVAVLVMRFEVL